MPYEFSQEVAFIPEESASFLLLWRSLDPRALPPRKAHPDDLGWDLYALEETTLLPYTPAGVRTGIALEFPPGVGGLIKDRSSLARRGIHTLAGVIDPGYRGEIVVVMISLTQEPFRIGAGERFAQLLLFPLIPAELRRAANLSGTERGEKGFGSSGRS